MTARTIAFVSCLLTVASRPQFDQGELLQLGQNFNTSDVTGANSGVSTQSILDWFDSKQNASGLNQNGSVSGTFPGLNDTLFLSPETDQAKKTDSKAAVLPLSNNRQGLTEKDILDIFPVDNSGMGTTKPQEDLFGGALSTEKPTDSLQGSVMGVSPGINQGGYSVGVTPQGGSVEFSSEEFHGYPDEEIDPEFFSGEDFSGEDYD